jgi:hypothetical protein
LDIPDSLYLQASAKAMSFGQDVGDFVVTVLQRELGLPLSKKGPKPALPGDLAYAHSDNGFLVFKRPSDQPVVTDALINVLREQEGV